MIAAAHVNWHYLLILLLPSVAACVMLALTWRSRIKRRGDAAAKPRRPSAAPPRGTSSAPPRRPANAKRRQRRK